MIDQLIYNKMRLKIYSHIINLNLYNSCKVSVFHWSEFKF